MAARNDLRSAMKVIVKSWTQAIFIIMNFVMAATDCAFMFLVIYGGASNFHPSDKFTMSYIDIPAYCLMAVAGSNLALGIFALVVSRNKNMKPWFQNHTCLVIYLILISFFLLLQIGSGVYFGIMKMEGIGEDTCSSFQKLMTLYNDGTHLESKTFVDAVQSYFQCCGYKDKLDYKELQHLLIPGACCPGSTKDWCGYNSAYDIGCGVKINQNIDSKLRLGILVLVAVALQAISTMVVTAYFLRKREQNGLPVRYNIVDDETDGAAATTTKDRAEGAGHFVNLTTRQITRPQ